MTYLRFTMIAIIAVGVLLAGLALARAEHDPSADIGNTVLLASWCKKIEDARQVLSVIKTKNNQAVADFFLRDDNTCYHIMAPRAFGLPDMPGKTVVVLEIMEYYELGEGYVAAIALVKDATGNEYYSYHYLKRNDT